MKQAPAITILLFALLALATSCASGDAPPVEQVNSKTPSKIDRVLVQLAEIHDLGASDKQQMGEYLRLNPFVTVVEDMVQIDAIAENEAIGLQADLKELGAQQLSSYGKLVSCRFPIAKIGQLAELETLKSARVSRPATH